MTGAAALAATGVALVRLGWGGRIVWAALGWLLAAAALGGGVTAAGAWGAAVVTLVGMVAALAGLAWSGLSTPGRASRPDRERVAIGRTGRLMDLPRRAAVFLLVAPTGGGAALALAFGVQTAARRAGLGEADTEVCFLFLAPVAWAGLMVCQLTRDGLRQMIAPPLLAAALGTLMWAAW